MILSYMTYDIARLNARKSKSASFFLNRRFLTHLDYYNVVKKKNNNKCL